MDMPRHFSRFNRLRVKDNVDEQRFLFHLDGRMRPSSLVPIIAVSQSSFL